MEPSLSFREEVNDNFRMTSGPHRTVWASILSPAIRFGGETEGSEVRGSAQLNVNRYFGEEGLDTTDRFFNLFSRFQWTERTTLGAAAGFTEDSTLQSELTETGLVLNRRQRRLRTLAPTWKGELTERATLEAGYRWTDVGYRDGGAGLFDYRTDTWKGNLAYRLSERDQVSAAVSYGGYRAPSASFRSGDAGVRFGATHLFSERWKGGVSGGAHRIVSGRGAGAAAGRDREWGWLIDADLEREWETATLRGGIGRDIQPSGAGALIQVDRLSVSMEKRAGPTMTFSFGGDAYRSRPFRRDLPRVASSYYRVRAGWQWRWTEVWSVEAGLSHAAERRERNSREIVANTASLKILYQGTKWSLSR